jgi:gluconokinase
MTGRIVLMGVAGCGKSSVGAALATRMGLRYRDGDDLHPPENIAKMRAGTPLTDADRWPWLDAIARELHDDPDLIAGCSALRRAYRDRLRAGAGATLRFVHLAGDRALIAARMQARQGHYMPPSLLDSQFSTLEAPDATEALTVNIDQPLDSLIDQIEHHLKGPQP